MVRYLSRRFIYDPVLSLPSRRYFVFEKQYNAAIELMKTIDLMYQTMLAELGQRSLDATWTADFPPEGRFNPANIKG